ncbi:MAG: hypothetical protein ASQ68_gp28 [Yellowstone Lake virophage 6]|uniref:hypothetical protein n=1 Tax=Yellowstone Lake virophage 6 TaxID=1557034 RepID=UPI000536179F|nr:MAG: hypothetical protein ASQ68_gp28 [Yellowstone Lake virophage 6]AIW01918.1 MAG: hypothetical protein YSLV6_ORF28 [Yellowstone Lake virophage 6]
MQLDVRDELEYIREVLKNKTDEPQIQYLESQSSKPSKSDLDYLRTNLSLSPQKFSIKEAKSTMKRVGFNKKIVDEIGKGSKDKLKEFFDNYEASLLKGSGYYIGGTKTGKNKKKKATPVQAIPAPAIPASTPAIPALAVPVTTIEPTKENVEDIDDATDPAEETTAIDDIEENLKVSEKVDEKLREVVDSGLIEKDSRGAKEAYKNKIFELATSLIQFIGRTTVLFITRIKKNLKYLEEDQYKSIYDQIVKFRNNLRIIRDYKSRSELLIKATVYTQLEKETIGLYNEINNSIRNYSKLKSYISLEPLQGGYFIQDDDSFIRQCLNKRFL